MASSIGHQPAKFLVLTDAPKRSSKLIQTVESNNNLLIVISCSFYGIYIYVIIMNKFEKLYLFSLALLQDAKVYCLKKKICYGLLARTEKKTMNENTDLHITMFVFYIHICSLL